jgi:hypothetical protein
MKPWRSVIGVAAVFVIVCCGSAGAAELITNGTFEGAVIPAGVSGPLDGNADLLPAGWTRFETFSGGVVENSVISNPVPNGPSIPGLTGWEFIRWNGGASGDWTAIEQPLNIKAADYSCLNLSMDVQVLQHNLVAGGWVAPAFEWPAMVEVDYLDTLNNPQVWRFGWYLVPPGDGPPGPVNDPGQGLIPFYNDMPVPAGVYVPNTFNLLNVLPQVQTITRIRVGGTGWDFHSFIDNVSLQGTPVPEPAGLCLIALGALGLIVRRR